MDTPYKNSTNLQATANQNNQSSSMLYPSMQPGFIPFEESTPKNKLHQNSRNNTPYNTEYFSGSRQSHHTSGPNWSHNRNNKYFRQNNFKNNSQFKSTDSDSYVRDNKDNMGNFSRPQFQNANSGFNKNRFNFPQNNRRENFFNNNGRRGGNKSKYGNSFKNKEKDNISISEFVHPSMLEDPWKELVERHNIIHSGNLKKSIQKCGKESSDDSSPDSDKNSNSNEDEDISNILND